MQRYVCADRKITVRTGFVLECFCNLQNMFAVGSGWLSREEARVNPTFSGSQQDRVYWKLRRILSQNQS